MAGDSNRSAEEKKLDDLDGAKTLRAPAWDDLDTAETLRGLAAGQVVFGRYRLERILGRGGMGIVWLARDRELELDVALKFLPDEISRDQEAMASLKRETRRGMELAHPNIVKTYGFLKDERAAAIAMEYIDGDTLSALKVKRDDERPWFEPEEIAGWVRDICHALDYAHRNARVIHRDLKPINLMVSRQGAVKITDFGVSQVLQDSHSRLSANVANTGGTLLYMSPQQALGEIPSVSDDLYSLGATLYDLLTGKAPFGGTPGTIYIQVREKVPPPLAQRRGELGHHGGAIPPVWEETIAACLAKEPAQRPRSAGEVAWRLGLVKEYDAPPAPEAGKPKTIRVGDRAEAPAAVPKARRGPMLAAIVLLLLLCGAAAGWWFGVEQPRREAALTRQQQEVAAKEAERTRQQQAETVRIAKEQAEAERLQREQQAQAERAAREKADAERKAREAEAEKTRLAAERQRQIDAAAGQARSAVEKSSWEEAHWRAEALAVLSPGHAELPALRKAIANGREAERLAAERARAAQAEPPKPPAPKPTPKPKPKPTAAPPRQSKPEDANAYLKKQFGL